MRISDWSSDVCSSDLAIPLLAETCPEHGRRGGGRSAYPWLDRILVVDVPVTVQHARLLQRDGIDAALADRMIDRKSVVKGKSVSVRVDLGGRGIIKKKRPNNRHKQQMR